MTMFLNTLKYALKKCTYFDVLKSVKHSVDYFIIVLTLVCYLILQVNIF